MHKHEYIHCYRNHSHEEEDYSPCNLRDCIQQDMLEKDIKHLLLPAARRSGNCIPRRA